jgi:uncharacterized membrane protein YozB (DUF420 family)
MSTIVASIPRARERFFLWMAIALALTVVWGFGPTYFFRALVKTRDLSPLVLVHGFLLTSWIAVLVAQTALVARERVDLHRRLGLASAALATLVVAAGVTAAIAASPQRQQAWAAQHGLVASLRFLVTVAYGPLAFGVFAACGISLRRKGEAHKRLMLLATFALMDAPIWRMLDDFGWPIAVGPFGFEARTGPFHTVIAPLLYPAGLDHLLDLPFFVALAVYDVAKNGRLHPITLYGGLAFFAAKPALAALLGLLAR